MNRYTTAPAKTQLRNQLARDVAEFLRRGGKIQVVDYTANQSWLDRERDKNNRYTRGDFSRL